METSLIHVCIFRSQIYFFCMQSFFYGCTLSYCILQNKHFSHRYKLKNFFWILLAGIVAGVVEVFFITKYYVTLSGFDSNGSWSLKFILGHLLILPQYSRVCFYVFVYVLLKYFLYFNTIFRQDSLMYIFSHLRTSVADPGGKRIEHASMEVSRIPLRDNERRIKWAWF